MKSLSNNQPITRFPLPEELVVSMSQHLGAPATLLKAVGDHVFMGEMIGQASSFISANVHSPVDGTVTAIKKVTMANSVTCDAVVIKPDEVQNDVFTERHDYSSLSKEELLAQIKEKGIVGLGGATFPAHVKMTISPGKSVENLVINGVECEPYLTADHRLMLEKPYEVLEGIMICRQILEPKNTIIGIEANKMDAVETLRKAIAEKGYPIQVMPLKMKYPQGDEKQLLKATINREIPSGKLPLDVGAVVVNVGTSYSIFNAIVYGKPIVERVVTISGECISKPCNVIAPIGAKVKDLIEFAGGFKEEPDKMISGGPMMGFAFYDEETPIAKGTSGILAIKDKKSYVQTACLSCGRCVAACP
ncbi:MAG TPA: electron transport complex subunit RsxC, partial [Sphaerochaeta sp.]|nr:electron transport complex subunit RsxC [Sphaerochaeta sp.]